MKVVGHLWKWGPWPWHPWAPASYATTWNSNLWYFSRFICVPICCHSEKSNQKQQILQTSLVRSNASKHGSVIWNELTFKFYFNQEIWYLAGFMLQCHSLCYIWQETSDQPSCFWGRKPYICELWSPLMSQWYSVGHPGTSQCTNLQLKDISGCSMLDILCIHKNG